LSSARAKPRAAGPQGYQSTGFPACWRRYGLDESARWFTFAHLLQAKALYCSPRIIPEAPTLFKPDESRVARLGDAIRAARHGNSALFFRGRPPCEVNSRGHQLGPRAAPRCPAPHRPYFTAYPFASSCMVCTTLCDIPRRCRPSYNWYLQPGQPVAIIPAPLAAMAPNFRS
jgi:hypothetical protein